MAGTTSVPRIQFTPTGLVVPTETEIKAGAWADMDAALGGGANPDDVTPQGQLVATQTAILGDHGDLWLQLVNNIDPDTASGFMQDAIGRIYFLDRLPALPTRVDVTCYGNAGVTIPADALVKDANGNQYMATAPGVIGAGGSVVVTFAAQVTGPINCPAGSIEQVPVRIVPGWDRAANLVDGITGRNVESRVDYEYRRRQSVAINARGTIPSIYANVFNLDGVVDVYALDNPKKTQQAVGTTAYLMEPNSILVVVAGGDPQEIAETIWRQKDVGANYNGNTSVGVVDMSYDNPRPTYAVQFHRPTATPIKFAVQIANISGVSPNAATLIKAAIVNAFNGGDGGQRARIGATIFAGRYYAPISNAGANIQVLSVLLGAAAPTATAFTPGIDQLPTINPDNITVTLV